MRVLLTGATGHLGRDICRILHEAGFDVVACDMNMRTDLPVRVRVANLLDRLKCYELVDGVDAIVHLAAHPNDYPGIAPQTILNENVSMTVNLLQTAHEVGVNKFLYASSVQAMAHRRTEDEQGNASLSYLDYLPADGHMNAHPSTPYSMSKYFGEETLKYYSREHGMDTVAFRFPWIISNKYFDYYKSRGARSHNHSGRYRKYWAASLDECFTCLSSQDAGRLIAAVLERDLKGYRCYFPVAPTPLNSTPIPELIESYYSNVELRKPIEEMTSLADISEITRETGWTPLDDLGAMVQETAQESAEA